jgi:nucleotide-binding universal stress UspA family protein
MRIGFDHVRETRRRARRLARRTAAVAYRSIVVPLLGRGETEYALDLACRLASERRASVVLVAPVIVDQELPLNANFDRETEELRERLSQATEIARSYGVGAKERIIRTRAGGLGRELAEVATDHRAELVVVGAPVESRRGFRRSFPAETLAIVRDAPCRVMIVSGPVVRRPSEKAALSRILVPMKLGPIGEEMVKTAIRLAGDQQAAVEALFVVKVPLDEPVDAPLHDEEERAAASLTEAASLGAAQGVQVVGRTVRARSIGEAIVAEVRESGADLVVLGSSAKWRRQARFFSPTVDYVLRHAPGEVLVVAFPQGATLHP